eukprot:gene10403-biopygen3295
MLRCLANTRQTAWFLLATVDGLMGAWPPPPRRAPYSPPATPMMVAGITGECLVACRRRRGRSMGGDRKFCSRLPDPRQEATRPQDCGAALFERWNTRAGSRSRRQGPCGVWPLDSTYDATDSMDNTLDPTDDAGKHELQARLSSTAPLPFDITPVFPGFGGGALAKLRENLALRPGRGHLFVLFRLVYPDARACGRGLFEVTSGVALATTSNCK